jgi:hypothetical protein
LSSTHDATTALAAYIVVTSPDSASLSFANETTALFQRQLFENAQTIIRPPATVATMLKHIVPRNAVHQKREHKQRQAGDQR